MYYLIRKSRYLSASGSSCTEFCPYRSHTYCCSIVITILFILANTYAQAQQTALSLEDVLVIVPAPSHVRSTLIERRCVSFTVDATTAQRLRTAGADNAFIAQVRNACELTFREAESVGSTAAYANYIARNPYGRFIDEARRRHSRLKEADMFQVAVQETRGPVYQYYGYQRYLKQYPTGSRAAEARAAMERLIR